MDPDTPLDQAEFDDPHEELFFAIAWCDRPGVAGDFAAKIRRAHARGAELDGPSADGEAPLTEAILGGEGSPTAVRVLLELGADPSRRAASGWNPWTACQERLGDAVVRERMEEIRDLLAAHGADTQEVRPPDDVPPGVAQDPPAEPPPGTDPRFLVLYQHGTNGINCDVTTERIVEVLTDWDERFGIEISNVGHDRLDVAFARLPDEAQASARAGGNSWILGFTARRRKASRLGQGRPRACVPFCPIGASVGAEAPRAGRVAHGCSDPALRDAAKGQFSRKQAKPPLAKGAPPHQPQAPTLLGEL